MKTLKQAVLEAIEQRKPKRVGELFVEACRTFESYAAAIGTGRPVPLQCPESLAVDANNRIVRLDAEFLPTGVVTTDAETSRAYRKWFPTETDGFASNIEASLFHRKALRLYFRELLGKLRSELPAHAQAALEKVVQGLGKLPDELTGDELDDWIRTNTEDWTLPIDEEAVADLEMVPVRQAQLTTANQRAPGVFRRALILAFLASLLLNLILATAIAGLVVVWPKIAASKNSVNSSDDASSPTRDQLLFSSYCVVFPTEGTIGEKVNTSLDHLFPGQIIELHGNLKDRDRLLTEKMSESLKSVKEPEKLKRLLVRLVTSHTIRFKGFSASDPNEGLSAVIERGGLFTIVASEEQHGSLLQPDGIDKLLKHAHIDNRSEERDLLTSLRAAIVEYASYKDALNIVGNRTAYLIHVEPTATAHETVRRKLIAHLDKPVFMSRPLPELLDAIDPSADTGGGFAAYSLKLDRKCYFRIASQDDRRDVDYDANTSNDRMKWQTFDRGHLISWKPIPLTRKSGKTDAVATFDIAVVLPNNVVVFRNQSIFVGDSRQQVMMQGRNYITKVLGIDNIQEIEDAMSVREQNAQFTGALLYSYLADQVTGDRKDVTIYDLPEFEQKKAEEDK